MAGLENWTSLSFAIGAAALIVAAVLYLFVRSYPAGNEAMRAASSAVRSGGVALLSEAAKVLGAASLALFLLLFWQGSPSMALAFSWGALLGAACCAFSFGTAVASGLRVAQAAREAGEREAVGLAFSGAAVAGLGALGLAVLGIGTAWVVARGVASQPLLVAFSLGTSCVALLARGAGGIYGRAADVAADLLARVEPELSESRPGNPAFTARDVGEVVGTAAGIPVEALACCAAAVAAVAMVAGGGSTTTESARIAYPILVLAAAVVASAAGAASTAALRRLPTARGIRFAGFVAPTLFLLGAFVLAKGCRLPSGDFVAVLAGLAGALAVGFATRGYASRRGVARIAGASQLGPAQNVISGFALGLEATAVPAMAVGGCLVVAGLFAGGYGVGLAAVGAASAVGLAAAMSVAAPVGLQARRIAEVTGLGGAALEAVRSLESETEAAATMGAGLRTAAAAFAGLAWVGAYAVAGGRAGIDLGHPKALVGVLLGAAIPFFVCSSALMAVGDVALEIVSAVRRQVRRGPEEETSRHRQAPAVSAGPRKLVVSGLLGLVAPVAVGFGLGAEALGGLLAGAMGTGILLSLFLLNVGDAWRGTRRQIEAGAMGGKGSEAHKAATVGDTLGEPLKDAAVPTLLNVLKVLAAASVIVAPLLS